MSEYISCDRVQLHPGDVIVDDGTTAVRYTVAKVLGEGSFGCVYKVRDVHNEFFALKLLKLWEVLVGDRSNLLKRFDREFVTGQIRSSYLVHSVAKGVLKGNPYIVMEYCPGGDLRAAAERGAVNLVAVASHVLYGLKDLHRNGKIHRDLKPENVLMRDNGHAVLTDFGIAGDQNNRLSQRNFLGVPIERFGTYAYMPPEQLNPPRSRNATVLPITDIFSFGVMVYQLLTGELPFGPLNSEQDLVVYTRNAKNGKWDRQLLQRKAPQWLPLVERCLVPKFTERASHVDDLFPLLPPGGNSSYEPSDDHDFIKRPQGAQNMALCVKEGETPGACYELNTQTPILTMGRDDADVYNRIRITENESTYVSRCHCTLEWDSAKAQWLLRDGQARVDCVIGKKTEEVYPCKLCTAYCHAPKPLQWKRSLNGTFVNSREVDEGGVYLSVGDIISMGEVKLRVEWASEARP